MWGSRLKDLSVWGFGVGSPGESNRKDTETEMKTLGPFRR